MYELPEIETICREITEIEFTKVIFSNSLNDSIFHTGLNPLGGKMIEKVERYGTYIIIKIEDEALLIKPRKTGKFLIEKGTEIISQFCLWFIQLDNGMQLRYVDTDSSPNILNNTYEKCIRFLYTKFGPDPFFIGEESFILNVRQHPNRTIKDVLMNDKIIFGIGNTYALESCYEARIHPLTLVNNMTDKQILNMLMCTKRVLKVAIENNGIFKINYRDKQGRVKINKTFLKVFRQIECNRCNMKITKATGNNYFCKGCQRLLEG